MSEATLLSPKYRSVDETNLSQELFNKVLCPNMRTGIRMSLLNPDSEGWVAQQDVRAYLEYIGLVPNTKVEDLLIVTGERAPEAKKPGFVNLTAFEGTFLDHGSSSGILNNPEGFSEKRLKLLESYAQENGRLYKKDFALAINGFNQCPVKFKSFLGTNILSFEFAGFLEIFGRTDPETSKKYFEVEDVVSLWKDNKFPEGWVKPEKTFYGSWPAFSKYMSMIWMRIKVGWWNSKPEK